MLRMPRTLLDEMRAHMEEAYPNECCGLIIGVMSGDGKAAVQIRRCRNLNTERARDRYELDPQDYLAVQEELEGGLLDVIGVYHSHPDHPSRPSQTDTERALPLWSYVIGSVQNGLLDSVQSWELDESERRFHEESIEIGEENAQ